MKRSRILKCACLLSSHAEHQNYFQISGLGILRKLIRPKGPCKRDKRLTAIGFEPECDDQGYYKPRQCFENQCWCCSPDGDYVFKTLYQRDDSDKPNCVQLLSKSLGGEALPHCAKSLVKSHKTYLPWLKVYVHSTKNVNRQRYMTA